MSAAFYVVDACGEKFLFTIAANDYEPAFRKHARWWIGYTKSPAASREAISKGRRHPVHPCRIVCELEDPA